MRSLLLAGGGWQRFVATAGEHGVLVLAQRDCPTAGPGAAPPDVLEDLREAAVRAGRRSLLLARELCAILDVLDAAGIPAVALKGPALAVYLYGDIGVRQCRDLDVLVRPGDVAETLALLGRRGYRFGPGLKPRSEARAFATQNHHRLVRDDGAIVELHWELAPPDFPFPLRADDAWPRLEPVRIGGRTVHTLGGEDLALFLCAHGAKHLWERLAWLCDVAALLARRRDVDWAAVLARARDRGGERMVLLALHLAHELLGAPVPDAVRGRVRADAAVRSLGERVRARLFAGLHPPTVWEIHAFRWRVRERQRDRMHDFARARFTPNAADWQLVRLPDRLYALYYLIRPLRLVAKYGARLLGALVR